MQRILEMFQIDLQWEVLEMLVFGRDVFVIHPKGLGKSLIFQSAAIFFDIMSPKCLKVVKITILHNKKNIKKNISL